MRSAGTERLRAHAIHQSLTELRDDITRRALAGTPVQHGHFRATKRERIIPVGRFHLLKTPFSATTEAANVAWPLHEAGEYSPSYRGVYSCDP
jgi:hypothetical protein